MFLLAMLIYFTSTALSFHFIACLSGTLLKVNVKKKKRRQEKQYKQLMVLVLLLNLAFNLIQLNFMRGPAVKIRWQVISTTFTQKDSGGSSCFQILFINEIIFRKGSCFLCPTNLATIYLLEKLLQWHKVERIISIFHISKFNCLTATEYDTQCKKD